MLHTEIEKITQNLEKKVTLSSTEIFLFHKLILILECITNIKYYENLAI